MNRENESRREPRWVGQVIAFLAVAVGVAVVVAYVFFREQFKVDPIVAVLGIGLLGLVILLRYADVARFAGAVKSGNDIPPLGLAHGSVRSIIALTILLVVIVYAYFAATHPNGLQDKIFTPLLSILSAVIGFYFGSRTASNTPAETKAPSPTIMGVTPKSGKLGAVGVQMEISGSGFLSDAAVTIEREGTTVAARNVRIVRGSLITCQLELDRFSAADLGKWDLVVTNQDYQRGILSGGFEVTQ